MRWMGIYLIGYLLLIGGVLLAFWKTGVLASIGPVWTGIGLLIAIGLGIMIAVTSSGEKKTIEVDKS